MNNMLTKVRIRWMEPADLPQIVGIEHAEYPFPWTDKDFEITLNTDNVIAHVACDPNEPSRVLGYMMLEPKRNRFNVLTLTVSWLYNADSLVFDSLLAYAKAKLRKGTIDKLILYVEELDVQMQVRLREHGFVTKRSQVCPTRIRECGTLFIFKYTLSASEK